MNRSQRVTPQQKSRLLEFMKAHVDLARGRVSGPDAARTKKVLLEELSITLNAFGSGAKKTPEKWWKCWQDWKSDTKGKALKINKYRHATGGGPAPAPLSEIEDTLIQFWGAEMVQGLDVIDPLEESAAIPVGPTVEVETGGLDVIDLLEESAAITVEVETGVLFTTDSHEEPVADNNSQPPRGASGTQRNRAREDPLLHAVERQAVAVERLATSMERIAAAIESTSATMLAFVAAMQQR